jgi:dihydroflavonol-4-reductase
VSRVVVTGASGLLGANLAAALIDDGHRVAATKRGSTKVDHLADLPIEWVTADLGDVPGLTQAFAGADAVFHCAAEVSIEKKVSPSMHAANVVGTEHVLAAARAARIGRLVHCSTVGAVALTTNGAPSDETAAWNFDQLGMDDGYVTTKHQSEELVRAAAADLDAVIVNPTYMFGPRDVRPSSGQLIVNVARRKIPGWTPGYNNFVDVRDVARGMIAAWHKGVRGERYILGGHDLTYRAIFERIAAVAGVRPPRFGIPKPIASLVGRFGDWRESRGQRPLVNSVQVRYAFTDRFRFTSRRAEAELDYTYGPIETAIADAIAWFRAHGML